MHTQSTLYFARAVLENLTPLSIATGSPDGVFDTALVRDANGLPALPGSSLAGVLRHLWASTHGSDHTNAVFGFQRLDQGQTSRLQLSWGALLDSQGRTAEGLLIGAVSKRLEDPLYAAALAEIDAPRFRNRVRLGHRGAAADTGKFDRAVLAAGHRFAVELRLAAARDDDGTEWQQVLRLLAHPALRLGGATRSGLGRLQCVSLHQRRFDLRAPADVDAFLALGRGLCDAQGLTQHAPQPDYAQFLSGELKLEPRGLWRIGQGDKPLKESGKTPDLLPVVEQRVQWDAAGRGSRGPDRLLLPAASLKGALAHRMAFHARRFARLWAEDIDMATADDKPAAVAALLGEVKDKRRGRSERPGQAGALYIDDAWLAVSAVKLAHVTHNGIDRFTGGVRDRVLFEEESVLGGELRIPITLDRAFLERSGKADEARLAFKAALDDLCQGRLALGSRVSTGNGLFAGELSGDLADWLNTSMPTQEVA